MIYRNVAIDAFGCELASEALTSEEIEARLAPVYQRLKLPTGRLELMTGIKERRLWAAGTRPSECATMAGRAALAASSVPKDKIGCLMLCSVCRDFLEPATATVVHKALGLSENCLVFDLSNACLGILTGMTVLGDLIDAGRMEAGMLVSGENSRSLIESTIKKLNEDQSLTRQTVKPYFASFTIGSGAVAVILSRTSLSASDLSLIGGSYLAVTSYNDLCQGGDNASGVADGSQTIMLTDAENLMNAGVEVARRVWELFKTETGWTADGVDLFCTHQVGSAHRRLLYERLGLDLAKDFPTFETLGNMGSASCPVTAAKAIESGALKPGGRLAMLGIGSGINCAMLGIERGKGN